MITYLLEKLSIHTNLVNYKIENQMTMRTYNHIALHNNYIHTRSDQTPIKIIYSHHIIGFRYFTKFWKSYALVTAPMVLLPVAFAEGGSEEMRCAYVVLLMAAYWMTEALPLAITSLIPMVLLPFLGQYSAFLQIPNQFSQKNLQKSSI